MHSNRTHFVWPGDCIRLIAKYYQITVEAILEINPRINAERLEPGTTLMIPDCAAFVENERAMETQETHGDGEQHKSHGDMHLINEMRLAWSQHVYWSRMLIVSIAERLPDLNEVTARLLKNPDDIAGIFAAYVPAEDAQTISRLLTEHLQIGAQLVTALRDRQPAEGLTRRWYQNADEIASALASLGYNERDMRDMLHKHLDLTTKEASMRLAGNFAGDIQAFDEVEREAMIMADMLSAGLINRSK